VDNIEGSTQWVRGEAAMMESQGINGKQVEMDWARAVEEAESDN